MSKMIEVENKDIQPAHLDLSNSQEDQGKKGAATHLAGRIQQQHADLYYEALEKYGEEGSIDPIAEKKLKR